MAEPPLRRDLDPAAAQPGGTVSTATLPVPCLGGRGDTPTSDVADAESCPYVGLRPYTETERGLFFGREREQRVVASHLSSAPLTVFYGASGVGKSSVLLAGVVPALKARPNTAVAVFRAWPRTDFLAALKGELIAAFPAGTTPGVDAAAPLEGIVAALAQAVGGAVLLVLDQFEEYFLYHPDTAAGDAFEREFTDAVNAGLDFGVLLSLREDSLARLDRLCGRIPTLLANTLRLDPLDTPGAAAAIRGPLAVFNGTDSQDVPVTVEDGFVECAIAEVGAGDGRGANGIPAATLQLVLTHIWHEEMHVGSRVLRLASLMALGDVHEIAHRHLAELMARLDTDEQRLCAQFFERMVTPSGAKIACRVADLRDCAEAPDEEIAAVLQRLAGEQVLNRIAPPQGDDRGAQYEICHDVLAPAILAWRHGYLQREQDAERARELAAARAQAGEEAAIARRMRRIAIGLGVIAFLAAIAAIGTLIAQQVAETQRRQKTELALSVQLVATSLRYLDSDPEISTHAALEALRRTADAPPFVRGEAEDAARRALDATRLRLTLHGHAQRVQAVAFSPDGTHMASAGQDGSVRLWDAANGAELAVLRGHEGAVRAVAFSPDGGTLASVGHDGRAILWDVARGERLRELPRQAERLQGVAFSPDGELVATVGQDPVVRLWDVDTGRLLTNLTGHRAEVHAVAFSPDGRRLATAGRESSVRIWNLLSGRPEHVLDGHTDTVFAVAFSPDGRWLASASQDRSVRLWDAASGALVRELPEQPDTVDALAFSPDGLTFATGGFDGTARLWDLTGCTRPQGECQPLTTLGGQGDAVHGLAFDPAGPRLATAGGDGSVRLWDVAFTHGGAISDIAFSPDGSRLATASRDAVAKIWDRAGGKVLQQLAGYTGTVFRVAWSPDGKRLATASVDGTAALWDATGAQAPRLLRGHAGRVQSVAFSADGRLVVTAGHDGMAGIWDAASGVRRLWLRTGTAPLNRALFSRDGQHVLTAGADGGLAEWNAANGKLQRRLQERGDEIDDIALSPDGALLAAAGADRRARLWDLASGKALRELAGHTGAIGALAFSPDGRLLATASRDRSARVWDVASGAERFTLPPQDAAVNAVAFSPDGSTLATGGGDKRVHFLPLDPAQLAAALRERVTHGFTAEECEKYLHQRPCPP